MSQLKECYEEEMKRLESMLTYPWHDQKFYASWLAQSYYYTRRGTRILLLAASHFNLDATQLHRRFIDHAREEKGHELLAVRDVVDLGQSVEQIGEYASTQAFYRAQYFTIQHQAPEVLFGWILVLEGMAITWGKMIRDRVVSSGKQIPTRFLDIHVDEDPDHVDKAFEVLKAPSVARFEREICENMAASTEQYLFILDQCRMKSEALILKATA